MTESLSEALPREMARVRDEVMPIYEEIGPEGKVALFMMRNDLDRATKALVSGDVVAMIYIYRSLQSWKV